jgi:hypothetical protein
MSATIASLGEFCGELGFDESEAHHMINIFRSKRFFAMARHKAMVDTCTSLPHSKRLPIRMDGEDVGVVQYQIPKKAFFELRQRANFGEDGLCDEGGIKDLLRAYPQFKVTTVSGKITSGYGGKYGGKVVKKYQL